MIVKKLINTKVEGNIEITKREIKEVPKEDEKKILDFVQDIIDDDGDPESYYSKGIADDFNGELAWISFDWLISYIEDRQTDLESEDEQEESEYKNNKEILPILIKYKGYVF